MSNVAMNWARKRRLPRSSDKFLLVMLAEFADERGICYPSQKSLADDTSLDPKTVAAGLMRLRDAGEIIDTGERKGATNQVVMWRLPIQTIPPETGVLPNQTPPETVSLQKSESPPFFPDKPTVFPVEGHRFSVESPPKTGDGTTKEPPKEPPEEPPGKTHASATPPPEDLFKPTPAPKPAKRERAKSRAPCPPDWWPDLNGLQFAAERNVDPKTVVPQFRDWHLAKGSLMADWSAAWRTWCGNQVRFAAERKTSNGHGKPKHDALDAVKAAWDYVNCTNELPEGHPAGVTIDAEEYHET